MADSIDNIFFISGAQLLEKMIASVLKPKSRQKEAFMQVRIYLSLYQIILLIILIIQNINFRPDIVTSTTEKKYRWQQYDKSDKTGRI